jgi:hypothetical protein
MRLLVASYLTALVIQLVVQSSSISPRQFCVHALPPRPIQWLHQLPVGTRIQYKQTLGFSARHADGEVRGTASVEKKHGIYEHKLSLSLERESLKTYNEAH